MILYSQLRKERDMIQKKIQSLKDTLKTLPDGELICVKNGHYIKWLISNHSTPIYLPKKERPLAELLAIKKYYSIQLKELTSQINLLDQFIERYPKSNPISSKLFSESSQYKELLHSYFQSYPDKLHQWICADYKQNKNHPENLIMKTLSGQTVRSKSEVIIANALYLNKIPFRYECELCFDDIKLYPDFTICHPDSQQIIYWEHFGMMDNTSYRETVYNKLKLFGNYDIFPTINLITTFETKSHPIDSEQIQQIIQEHILS